MKRLWRAVMLYLRSDLTWRCCRRATSGEVFYIVRRDGFLYVEPWSDGPC